MVTIKASVENKKQIEDLDVTLNITMKLSEWIKIKDAIPFMTLGSPDMLRASIAEIVHEYNQDLKRNFEFSQHER